MPRAAAARRSMCSKPTENVAIARTALDSPDSVSAVSQSCGVIRRASAPSAAATTRRPNTTDRRRCTADRSRGQPATRPAAAAFVSPRESLGVRHESQGDQSRFLPRGGDVQRKQLLTLKEFAEGGEVTREAVGCRNPSACRPSSPDRSWRQYPKKLLRARPEMRDDSGKEEGTLSAPDEDLGEEDLAGRVARDPDASQAVWPLDVFPMRPALQPPSHRLGCRIRDSPCWMRRSPRSAGTS